MITTWKHASIFFMVPLLVSNTYISAIECVLLNVYVKFLLVVNLFSQ